MKTAWEIGWRITLNGAYLRTGAVLVGAARSWLQRGRFRSFRFGWVEILNAAEPVLLVAVTTYQYLSLSESSSVSGIDVAWTTTGAALVLGMLGFLVWSLASWRGLFTGHVVVEGQQLVKGGAYGLVRHPVYLGVILGWIGVAMTFRSVPIALLTAAYVVPVYVLYARSEERMMSEAFGEEYERYRRDVPMLIPTLRS